MFWKVPGFCQPSPVEQILDKEEFTLEELLDEDDIIQECKSLNSRLVAFLRERSVVDQLLRYMIEPQDSDDPKRTYKYPFTSCEVLCCELEAVYNTLLEDAELMKLLFSLLDEHTPLSCKTAGYFGRVVGTLLSRKQQEMFDFFKEQGNELLEKLVKHIATTSIADVIKRMLGADDQNGMLPLPAMTSWLAETPLIELLLGRLAAAYPSEAQVNAADILCATAYTQPSPPASKLTEPQSISALMEHALAPGRAVLVPALDVCIALLEPRRGAIPGAESSSNDGLGMPSPEAQACRDEAVSAIVSHLPKLVALLEQPTSAEPLPMPAGQLAPPLGRHRLKVVELLSVLVRSGSGAEAAIVSCGAIPMCLKLFADFPFNNLLHHNVAAMLVACASSSSNDMLQHLFEGCDVLDWIVSLPTEVRLPANVGVEDAVADKPQLRAGYLGHVTQIGSSLENIASGANQDSGDDPSASKVAKYMEDHAAWKAYVESTLRPQQELENTDKWACGRPATQHMGGMDSDGDEFAHDMELEQLPLYSRYSSEDNDDDEGDDDEGGDDSAGTFQGGYGADLLADAMSGMDLVGHGMFTDGPGEDAWGEDDEDGKADDAPVTQLSASSDANALAEGMDDDDVLLANSDEEFPSDSSSPEAPGKTPSSADDADADESTTGRSAGVDGSNAGSPGGASPSAESPSGASSIANATAAGASGSPDGKADNSGAGDAATSGITPDHAAMPSSWPLDVASEASAGDSEEKQ